MAFLTPHSSSLRAMAAANLSWKAALCELIDNSFDADATEVDIELSETQFRIADNGNGIEELPKLFTQGERQPHATTKLGRYGVGAFDALIWMSYAGSVSVDSMHGGVRRAMQVNWRSVENNKWATPDPYVIDSGSKQQGTTIVVPRPDKHVPHGQRLKTLIDDLGYLYSPALKPGDRQRQIKIRSHTRAEGVTIPRWELPKLAEFVDKQIVVNGKKARVYCGIVAEGEKNPRFGLTYVNSFRVILPASANGCQSDVRSYNLTRVCGFVELKDGWELSKLKEAILDDAETLYASVFQAVLPILMKADEQGMRLQSAAFDGEVSNLLNSMLSNLAENAKAVRGGRGGAVGTVEPKNTGRRHKRAAHEQAGKTFVSRFRNGVRIVRAQLGGASGYGKVDGGIVYLDLDNSLVRNALDKQNTLATAMAALTTIGLDAAYGGRQLPIKGIGDDQGMDAFQSAVAQLSRGVCVDSQLVAAE